MKIILFVLALSALFLLTGCSGEPNLINSPDDIRRTTTIGALAGSPSFQLARELGTPVAYTSEIDMMNDLRTAVIDCVIMESTTAEGLVSNVSGVRILSDPLVEYELRIGVPRENTALLGAVNNALEELHRNGTLRGIAEKYFARRDFTFEPTDDDANIGVASTLTVALPSDSPPFSFRNEEGRFVGMDVEVAIAVADVLGVSLTVLETDVTELVESVWLGLADFTLGWHTVEGEGIINMSEPYAHAEHVIIVRR